MAKYVLIPDSFKGTMSSTEICRIMSREIRRHEPEAEITSIPVADGGEGSVDCFLEAVSGEKRELNVDGVFIDERVTGFYGLLDEGRTAVIEVAACAGLPLAENRLDPLRTTTYGVGQLMLDAAEHGAKKIIVGLGGSATNDGGCGAAAACGVKFLDDAGWSFVPTGGTLKDIAKIDTSETNPRLKTTEIIAMCDIDNPMYGPQGAAYIFAPQKGADPDCVELLDEGLKHLARILTRDLKIDVSNLPGSGAAGAMGAGMMAFFGAKLEMGIDTVLDTVKFDDALQNADLVLTGEGRIDTQSLRGKVAIGVARRAKQKNVPVIAIVGDIGDNIDSAYSEGITAILSINRVAKDFTQVRDRSPSDLALTIDTLMRLRKL